MLFDTMEHNMMRAAINGQWVKQQVISQNLSNYDTPGYKAKIMAFEDVFNSALDAAQGGSNKYYHFRARIGTDDQTEVRTDGNNVNVEKENLELFKSYVHSSALYQKIGGQFTNLRYAINQFTK